MMERQLAVQAVLPRGIQGARTSAALVLFLMFCFNMMNFLDRMLFAILQEPIKHDLALSDTELGLLGGPAFAILYALAALPIARMADRSSRVHVIGAVLSLWSLMTGLCGAAGSFVQLFLGRVGVSIGEAGCAPAAHSLISDYFPPGRRAGAISVFTAGTSVGTLMAAFAGGALAHAYGWRITFILCGVLGILLAGVILLAVREPLRTGSGQGEGFSLTAAVGLLRSKPSYLHLCAGMSLATLSGFAAVQYLTSFLIRAHGLSLVQAAQLTGAMVGGVGFVATITHGVVVDRFRRRYPRVQMMLPAVAVAIGAFAYWTAFLAPGLAIVVPALVVAVIGMQSFLGAGFALAQDLAPQSMRSTSAGLLMLIIGVVGYAFGSPLVGMVSDAVAHRELAGSGLTITQCATLVGNARCAAATVDGLRWGLVIVVLPMLWSSLHFWLASRTMIADVARHARASPATAQVDNAPFI